MIDVEPPRHLLAPLEIPQKLLMGPGPTNCHQRVLKALTLPLLPPMDPVCFKYMDEVKEGLKYLFQTSNPLTLALSCSGLGGLQTILSNILRPEDTMLTACGSSYWGEKAVEMAKKCGAMAFKAVLDEHTCPLKQIRRLLFKHKPKILLIIHGDSSTGILQNLEGIGDLCRKYDCLFIVDCVATLGAVPLFVDRWKIDVAFAASQKAIGAPAGLTVITFSDRAKRCIYSRNDRDIPTYYFNIKNIFQYWNCVNEPRRYHHTLSTPLLLALREALALIVEEGLENMIDRHKRAAEHFYKELQKIQELKHVVDHPNRRFPSVTLLEFSDDINRNKFLDICRRKHRVEIGEDFKNPNIIRVGIMGPNASLEKVNYLVNAFKDGITFAKQSRLISKL